MEGWYKPSLPAEAPAAGAVVAAPAARATHARAEREPQALWTKGRYFWGRKDC